MEKSPTPGPGLRNALLIAASFFFVFFGFGTAQQYLVLVLTPRGHGHLALVSLLVLYGTFMVTSMLVSRLIPLIGGLKRSLMIGAGTYALFTLAVALDSAPLLIIASIVIGIGASLLWIASAAIISDSSSIQAVGRNLGIQNIGLYCGTILGVFAGSEMVKALTFAEMYVVLGAIAALGILPLILITPSREEVVSRPFRIGFVFDRRMLALFPLLFGSYYLQGQMFTAMNIVIVELLGLAFVPIIISAMKLSSMAGSFGIGALSGRVDKIRLLLVLLALTLLGSFLFIVGHAFFTLLLAALLLGFSTISMYPVALAILKEAFTQDEYLYALGTFNLYNNIGVMAALAAGTELSARMSFVPGMIALVAAIPCVFLSQRLTAARI